MDEWLYFVLLHDADEVRVEVPSWYIIEASKDEVSIVDMLDVKSRRHLRHGIEAQHRPQLELESCSL